MRFDNLNLKVVVHKPSEDKKIEEKKVQTVAVDVINQTAKVVEETPDVETKTTAEVFKDIKNSMDHISVDNAAHLIVLELKRVYIDCIDDEHNVNNTELDKIFFSAIEDTVRSILLVFDKECRISLENIILDAIANSVKVLGIGFDFSTMYRAVLQIGKSF